ncbi:hypothetical protein FQN54_009374 [Arachnomyces sp. PD_36]|nr:hypothetical protein FQN54_009374 [Arachnomyces sp. PD_36]
MPPQTRRRVCRNQSKYGCLTCKARRVKCDEQKPVCQRCTRSKRKCEGYAPRPGQSTVSQSHRNQNGPIPVSCKPVRATRATSVLDTSSQSDQSHSEFASPPSRRSPVAQITTGDPQYSLNAVFRESLAQDRLSRLGCRVLNFGIHNQFAFGCETLEHLVPRLSHSLPSVNAAAAAVGAYYELQISPSSDKCREGIAARQYQRAIQHIQHDLVGQPHGLTPLLIGCMLLLLTEVLLRRRQGALVHLRAAYKILELRKEASKKTPNSTRALSPPQEVEDDLDTLFRSFDVHTAAYSNGKRGPDTPQSSTYTTDFPLLAADDIHSLGRHVISEIHSSYHFTWIAASFAETPNLFIPRYILIEQGRHIGALNYLLRIIDHDALPSIGLDTDGRISPKYEHILTLRNICLSSLIRVSTILHTNETTFDTYADLFQRIITTAETILDNRQREDPNLPPPELKFTPSLGIIQPLYLAAMKYRHPYWRRRAISCLQRSGREGPWIGNLVAAVIERAADIEESGCRLLDVTAQDVDPPALIPEQARLSVFRMAENNGSLDNSGNLWLTATRGVTRVQFVRCRDPNTLEKQKGGDWHEYLQFELGKPYKLLYSDA